MKKLILAMLIIVLNLENKKVKVVLSIINGNATTPKINKKTKMV